MKIKKAALCPECDEVFNLDNYKQCPKCLNKEYLVIDFLLQKERGIPSLSSEILDFTFMGIDKKVKTFKISKRYLRINYKKGIVEETDSFIGNDCWTACPEIK